MKRGEIVKVIEEIVHNKVYRLLLERFYIDCVEVSEEVFNTTQQKVTTYREEIIRCQ